MIYKQNNKTILRMVQGDTEEVTLTLQENGEATTFSAGDVVKLSVKKIGGTSTLIAVSATAAAAAEAVTVTIPSSATTDMTASEFDYVYDVEVDFATGEIMTLIPYSPFVLIEQVTT